MVQGGLGWKQLKKWQKWFKYFRPSICYLHLFVYMCMCMHVCVCVCVCVHATAHAWRSDGNFQESILSFYQVASEDENQSLRFDSQHLHSVSYHLAGLLECIPTSIINVTPEARTKCCWSWQLVTRWLCVDHFKFGCERESSEITLNLPGKCCPAGGGHCW
jgi:hypothetical protein